MMEREGEKCWEDLTGTYSQHGHPTCVLAGSMRVNRNQTKLMLYWCNTEKNIDYTLSSNGLDNSHIMV